MRDTIVLSPEHVCSPQGTMRVANVTGSYGLSPLPSHTEAEMLRTSSTSQQHPSDLQSGPVDCSVEACGAW